jgi:hypothetical protein
MTIRKDILTYLGQLLDQVPNATVYRSRQEALARDEGTGIFLQPEEEPVERRAGDGPSGLVLRNLTIIISVIARAAGAPESCTADDVADPVMGAVHALVMADTTLGNRCATVLEEGSKWDFEQADGTAVVAEMRYVIRYMTKANTLSVQS